MIYTVTFNPAIDYVMKLDSLTTGTVNRSRSEELFFGGKGINVSVILHELGVASVAMGFTAGFTGEAIEKGVEAMGIETDFVRLESGNSRINVKLKHSDETELNGQGPQISESAIKKLFDKLNKLHNGDTLVLAGSIPNTLPSDMYEKILDYLSEKNIRFVVDATGKLLMNVLKYKPFLIKPNNFELEEIFGVKLNSNEEIIKYATKLQKMGACNVLVSMAENGSILIDENAQVHISGVPEGVAVNSVGAGDSMLAGFLTGFVQKKDYNYALRLGTACGSATAFSEGLAVKEDIYNLLRKIPQISEK